MRRLLLLAFAVFALSLVACGDSSDDGGKSDVNAPPAESSPSEDLPPSDEPKYTATGKEKYDEGKSSAG